MKLLLTGATGFIGRQLAKRLIAEGHDLSILIRPGSHLGELQNLLATNQVHLYDGSYTSLLRALRITNPEIVFHLASLFLAQHKLEDVHQLIESNINFPGQLLECMKQLGIKKIINTGTSWQHYNNEEFNPVNLYAATKQAFKALLAYYYEAHNFKVITLSLFDTYGPGDTRSKIFSHLRRAVQNGTLLRMSPGEQLLDLVYIDDVLEAFLVAMIRISLVEKSESFAVSSLQQISLKELVVIYSEAVGRLVPVEWGGQPYRFREVLIPWTNYKSVPDWKPKVNLYEGITRMESDHSIDGLLVEN